MAESYNRLPRMETEIRQTARGAEVGDQCQRTIADGGLANTDEHVSGAEIQAEVGIGCKVDDEGVVREVFDVDFVSCCRIRGGQD